MNGKPEYIEPDIARQMQSRPLEIPVFQPHVKEADLGDFSRRDRRLLLEVSVLHQQNEFIIRELLEHNRVMRMIESEQIRQRRYNSWWVILKWFALTAGAGLIGGLTSAWWRRFFQPGP